MTPVFAAIIHMKKAPATCDHFTAPSACAILYTMNHLSLTGSSWAWYQAPIAKFLAADSDAVIGRLSSASNFNVSTAQIDAWQIEIECLKEWLAGLAGEILLEFTIPRMGSRIDAVVLIGPAIFVIEFKAHTKEFERSSIEQVWDYALDLKNFHEASHHPSIIPILVVTDAATSAQIDSSFADDGVCRPLCIHPGGVRAALEAQIHLAKGDCIDAARWAISRYRPTPTIIEAARALYANHSVHDIARHDAGAINLRVTSQRVENLIEDAKQTSRKLICFVTGVPGAGKTLVGLNVATQRRDETQPTHAVFLSGNGPLVAVLREALVRDEVRRRRQAGERTTKRRVSNPVKAFIQNVHHFRDAALQDSGPPIDHVVIFDEAQRAWTREKTAKFMKQKKGQPNFLYSEPAFLMSYLDRHPDWAVVVCLVGGGQEIHTGEAGIGEWLQACNEHFRHWSVYISSNLTDTEYAAGHALDEVRPRQNAYFEDSLHLSVSMRSFRAENVSNFVKAVLDCDREAAIVQLEEMKGRFPVVLTRDLQKAKSWIRRHARGSERFGLVASSKAMRLKPHAIDIRVAVDPVQWFLNDRDDTRSSYYLEDCATEFQVQGLELDWTCVNWDGDLRYVTGGWSCHDFRGNRWENVKKSDRQNYLKNAYRVLLTRARQGMVVFIPPGDPDDHTRLPKFYNSTFDYLAGLGIPVLQ